MNTYLKDKKQKTKVKILLEERKASVDVGFWVPPIICRRWFYNLPQSVDVAF